jgi:hypothetical protein
MKLLSIVTAFAMAACGSAPPPTSALTPTPTNQAAPTSCDTRAADLHTYLASVFDKSAKPAPPWPTGDTSTDKRIDEVRAKMRAAMNPDTHKASDLAAGIPPGPLDDELKPCQPAVDSLANVGRADTDAQKLSAFTGIADAIGTCNCNVNLPFVRASLYLLVRGPE